MAKKKQYESSSEEEQFHVEVITSARVNEEGEWDYLVKWANYDSDSNSWEPEVNVEGCDRLLKSFWKHVGIDNNDYPVGYEINAKPAWIAKEKSYFASTFGGTVKSHKKRKFTQKDKVSFVGSDRDSSVDSDTKPLVKMKQTFKKRAQNEVEPSTETEQSAAEKPRKIPKVSGTVTEGSTSTSLPQEKRNPRAEVSVVSNRKGNESPLFSGSSSPDMALKTLPPITTRKPSISKPTETTTQPSSSSNLPPKQQARRGIKLTPLQLKGTGAAIATKAQLAQGFGAYSPSTQSPQSSLAQKGSLANLSFKKKDLATANMSTSRPVQGAGAVLEPHLDPLVSFDLSDHPSPIPDHPYHQLSPDMDPMAQANNFLASVMPPEMAAPLIESAGDDHVQPPLTHAPTSLPKSVGSLPKATGMSRIPKKWRWIGDLYIDVQPDRAERICNAALCEPSEPRHNGLRFSICLDSVDSLRLSKLYSAQDVCMLLCACDPVQQFAKLVSQGDTDGETFKTLATHLKQRQLCTYAHLFLDNIAVALLLVFPSALKDLCLLLKVPPDLIEADSLIAALIPWTLAADEYEHTKLHRARSMALDGNLIDPALADTIDDSDHQPPSKQSLHRALRILKCPPTLLDYLLQRERPYCIWHSPADGSASRPGFETGALQLVLKAHGAKDVGYKADVRFVFVHVGALATLHKVGALAMRRNKQPELRFMTYGTHDSVPPERWGVRHVYPIGGVVTFSPSAILENLAGTYDLIRNIAEHPLWTCYILPSVVTVLAKLTCQGSHPLVLFDKGEFVFDELLELIESGELSLLQAPPLSRAASAGDPVIAWGSGQIRMMPMNAREILEECITLATNQYSGVDEAELPLAIEKEVLQDLWNMQLQPVIMDQYRRFVVVTGRGDKHLTGDENGVECVSLKQFDFKDDYFEKEAQEVQQK